MTGLKQWARRLVGSLLVGTLMVSTLLVRTLLVSSLLVGGRVLAAEGGEAPDATGSSPSPALETPPQSAPVLSPTPAQAQTPAPESTPVAVQTPEASPEGRFGILPVPAFGYAPETRLYGGAVALFTLRPPPHTTGRTSNAKLEFNATQNRQLLLDASWEVFLRDDRWIVSGDAAFQRYPENIYALGPEAPASSEERYSAKRIELEISPFRCLYQHLYLGPSYRLQDMLELEVAPGGLLDSGALPGATGGLSSGGGYRLVWDSRDNVLNPAAGSAYISLTQLSFLPALGSDYRFGRLELDLRGYVRTFPRHVLALQGFVQRNSGDPPFRMLGMLGGDRLMRGYYYGRYRDRALAAVQAEYRVPVYGRVGAVVFAGVGEVGDTLSAFRPEYLKYSGGGGLRIEVDKAEHINLRLDYAVAQGSTGFYLGFGEAF